MRLVVLAIALFSSQCFAWDAIDCADSTARLRAAAEAARDAGSRLATSASGGALSAVRAALSDTERWADRARAACGGRSAVAAVRPSDAEANKALEQIEQWTARMQSTDPRYKDVEEVLLKHVEYVIKGMPAHFWLPTLQLMYGAVSDATRPARPPALHRF